MAQLTFKKGEANYTEEQIQALYIFAHKIASILDRLSESDARFVAFAIDPTLDQYVLGGWDKRNIIQEAIETMIADRFSPEQMNSDTDLEENLFSVSDSIKTGVF